MHATRFDHQAIPPRNPAQGRRVLVLGIQAGVRLKALVIAGLAGAALIAASLLSWTGEGQSFFGQAEKSTGPVRRIVIPNRAADLSIILQTDVMPLAADDARALNEKRPVDVTEVEPATPFRVASSEWAGNGFAAALKCLAQAIYYEAASEPEAGQRAVAQVVLNRVRHPAFPNTICGVVYQGSQRVTGCQFTFTCDGSLARVPLPALYRRAEQLAREAMSGRVASEVGNSTNYHADYVVPYWAPSLNKLTQIGRHIFYGLRGAIGSRSAFRIRYDVAREFDPSAALLAIPTEETTAIPDPLTALPGAFPVAPETNLNADLTSGFLIPGAAHPPTHVAEPAQLRADQERGQLIEPGSRLEGGGIDGQPQPTDPR